MSDAAPLGPHINQISVFLEKSTLSELSTHKSATPVSAKTPCHMVALPVIAKNINSSF
ncbi:MAG: hypothetical protein XD56_1618, partial [Pseudothermotoga lettingae]